MSIVKKLSFLLLALLLVGCNDTEESTGDVEILNNNIFLTDENHIIQSVGLEGFLEILEEKKEGKITEENDDEEEEERDRTDSEKRTIVVFGSITHDKYAALSFLLNDIAKDEQNDKFSEIYSVNINSEYSEYTKYVQQYVDAKEDNHDTESPSDSANVYLDLLDNVGIQKNLNYIVDEQWAYAQKYSDLKSADHDLDNTPVESSNGSIENASIVGEGTVIVYDKEGNINGSFLLNSKVISLFSELYDEDEDTEEVTFNDNGKCFMYGECSNNSDKDDYKGLRSDLLDLFKNIK